MTSVELIHTIYSIYGTEDAELSLITINYLSFKIKDVDVCIQVATLECSRDSDGHGGRRNHELRTSLPR